jgi:DNA-binding beta-propeller fold protein YncE
MVHSKIVWWSKFIGFAFIAVGICSCKKDKSDPEPIAVDTKYPAGIEAIIKTKCAVSGCHNDISKDAAAGLSMETWDKLFEGGRGGAAVIPYSSDFSTLFYYINTDSTLGLTLEPTMPVNSPPLSQVEVLTIKNWIDQGAPNRDGFVKFSDNPTRKKFYVANQGCDVVTVFDANSMLAMRVKSVGNTSIIESPHMIKVSHDNQFWFTCFLGGTTFQKYSTADNSLVSEAQIGTGSWNTYALSPDGLFAYLIDFTGGKIEIVDLTTMSVSNLPGLNFPHGVSLNNAGDTLYVTEQIGSSLTKFPVNDLLNNETISMVQNIPASGALQIHEIAFTPDGNKYFVTCQNTNEVRAIMTSNDSVVAAISVPEFPQEMAFTENFPYLFVSCMEAGNPDPQKKSYISVINYQTNTLIKTIYAGYQSHGIAVDEINNRVYVTNRNVNSNGPAPHHSSVCGGRNGNITAIDLNTLELVPGFKTEVSVDPYGIGITY